MKRISNNRRCILILPESKLILKPGASVAVKELNEELQKAISKGWINLEDEGTKISPVPDSEDSSSSAPVHDWEVDYSRVEENLVTVMDKISGKSVTDEIQEKKGNQHFTLKDIGTVKKTQFWPTIQALEQFDGVE